MATMIQRAYDVEATHTLKMRAFVLFDYSTNEVTASLEYDGFSMSRVFKSREGIEYAAIQAAAYHVADTIAVNEKARPHIYYVMEQLANNVAEKVDAYLYSA